MSKNIVVQRDGVAENYTVKKIHTTSRDGDNATWIPLDETEQAIKTIVRNGTYKASSDGYYGYSKVIVKAGGKTVGTKPDGKTYAIGTDDDGWLTETLLPDSIRITTQPTKTSYSDGESIDLTGAVVKAYSLDDLWEGDGYSGGVIPLSELTTEPSVASGGGADEYQATSDLDIGVESIPCAPNCGFIHKYHGSGGDVEQITTFAGGMGTIYMPSGAQIAVPIIAGDESLVVNARQITRLVETEEVIADSTFVIDINNTTVVSRYSMNGKTVYYYNTSLGADGYEQNASPQLPVANLSNVQIANIAWTMAYGVISGGGSGINNVVVFWNRPEDDKRLSDSYDISVTGGNNGTGNS